VKAIIAILVLPVEKDFQELLFNIALKKMCGMRNLINNFLPPYFHEKEGEREKVRRRESQEITLMHAYLFKHHFKYQIDIGIKRVYQCLSINDADNITIMYLLLRKHRYR